MERGVYTTYLRTSLPSGQGPWCEVAPHRLAEIRGGTIGARETITARVY